MSSPAFAWSDEGAKPASAAASTSAAPAQFAWSDEKESAAAPVTMNAKRGGSSVTEPDVKAAAIDSRSKMISDKAANSFGFMAGGGLEKVGEEAPAIIPAIKSAWGKVFPPKPVYPGAELPEVPTPEMLQANHGLAEGAKLAPEPASALGRIAAPRVDPAELPSLRRTPGQIAPEMVRPRAYIAHPAEPIPPRTGLALPPAPAAVAPAVPKVVIAAPSEYPPAAPQVIQRGPIPGSPEDVLETRSIQEEVRDRAESEDRSRLSAAKRDWFARNQPGSTKAELTGTADKPVRYTKTPGVKIAAPPSGTVVPAPDEDLTPLLQKSLKAAKKAKG